MSKDQMEEEKVLIAKFHFTKDIWTAYLNCELQDVLQFYPLELLWDSSMITYVLALGI